ncbi:MAG: hypothetical protein CFE45_35365, partial [Burkholderiales bacterium PBB5]
GLLTGSTVDAGPAGTVTLSAGRDLLAAGHVTAPGGAVSLALAGAFTAATAGYAGSLVVDSTARIDVAGTTLLTPTTNGLRQGRVLPGGTVDIAGARLTPITLREGSVIDVSGTSATLDLAAALGSQGSQAFEPVLTASAGGTVRVSAREGGAQFGSQLLAHGGGNGAAGGSLQVRLQAQDNPQDRQFDLPDVQLVVQAAAAPNGVKAGQVTLSSNALAQAGLSELRLQSSDRIRFDGSQALHLARDLVLDAPIVELGAGAAVNLSAGSVLTLGN